MDKIEELQWKLRYTVDGSEYDRLLGEISQEQKRLDLERNKINIELDEARKSEREKALQKHQAKLKSISKEWSVVLGLDEQLLVLTRELLDTAKTRIQLAEEVGNLEDMAIEEAKSLKVGIPQKKSMAIIGGQSVKPVWMQGKVTLFYFLTTWLQRVSDRLTRYGEVDKTKLEGGIRGGTGAADELPPGLNLF
jgi:hypothetical protein